ncbi:MAG: hypothetical protein KC419_20785 [Anaerolineales bacterium]|nr:hypothetical protein [Anaerolineales bacterium]
MNNNAHQINWRTMLRIGVKTAVLLLLCNLLYAAAQPLPALGKLSLYNNVLPGRERLPYGENSAESYNLSLNSVPAMMHSHVIARPKAADEFRVLVLGDSGVWGWHLQNDETLVGQLNTANLAAPDGRRLVFYNLGYPILSATKDLLLLQAGLAYEPDAVIWLVTLQSLARDQQLRSPLLTENPALVRPLLTTHHINLNPNDSQFANPTFWNRTIIGQRRELANWARLQAYGFSWMATGIDQAIPADIPLRQSDFDADESWLDIPGPTPLTADSLTFDVLAAGVEMSGDLPVLIVNEPIFVSNGRNHEIRYNSFYPRWAYDTYREVMAETAVAHNWRYLDAWNTIPSNQFGDSPVHLTPIGSHTFADQLAPAILKLVSE